MWPDGYLEQARSDWEVYNTLRRTSVANCQILHYLQMATEKLGKALLLVRGASLENVMSSHRAFTRFLQIASRNRGIRTELGMTAAQLRMHIQQLLPIAHDIERLAPALADGGPNVEYPWEFPLGTINVPALYNFPVDSALRLPRGERLLKLINLSLESFYRFFTE